MISGWILIDKPAGKSSRFVGGKIARMFGVKKFGHLGTLDPFATGILPIALGHATKMIPFIESRIARFNENRKPKTENVEKIYEFKIKWGIKTDTDDITGKTTENKLCTMDPPAKPGDDDCVCRPNDTQIKNAISRLIGDILQIPPAFSAIHIDGVRAYDLARRGIEFEIPARKVHIFDLKIIENTGKIEHYPVRCASTPSQAKGNLTGEMAQKHYPVPDDVGATPSDSGYPAPLEGELDIDDILYNVKCSSGTYVRTLAQQICELCNESINTPTQESLNDKSLTDSVPPRRSGAGLTETNPHSTLRTPHFICTTSMIRRVQTHGFNVENAVTLDFLENVYNNTPDLLQNYLQPVDFGLDDILVSELNNADATLFQNGGRIRTNTTNVGLTRVKNSDQLIGIAESKDGVIHPIRILKD